MRVVIDTNVVVSRFLSRTGAPARIFEHWEQQAFTLLVSEPILEEYRQALSYPHVQNRHQLSQEALTTVIAHFRRFAALISPGEALHVIRDDPDDSKFLACAVAGGADYLVSGDRHLLRV